MIIFKNLLAENKEEDFCYGVPLIDGSVYCLCGCNGTFEKGDYAIVSAKADADSNIEYHKILARRKELFHDRLNVLKGYIVEYGYSWEGMHGITAEIGKLLFQYNVETYRLYEDGTEGAVNGLSEFDTHDGWFGVEKETLEAAIQKGKLDNFFFENWEGGIRPIKLKMNTYVVCMNSEYVRDAQMLDTSEMTDEEFEAIDWQSSELDDFWHDMEPIPFIGIVKAESEEQAIALAAKKYRYDKRCLYVAKKMDKNSESQDAYTLTVMGILDGEFDLSTRVFNSYEKARAMFDSAIAYQKDHTWISDYRIEELDENDLTTNESRVLTTKYHLAGEPEENMTWEAYRDGYCSSAHTIIKLEKQVQEKTNEKL